MQDALSYENNLAMTQRYGALLLWGTVGLAAFGGVVVVTRRRAAGGTAK